MNDKVEDNPTSASRVNCQSEDRKRRKMPHETSHEVEETKFSNEKSFNVNVFYVIVDQINASMEIRVSDQKRVYQNFSCFDPARFTELRKTKIAEHGLEEYAL